MAKTFAQAAAQVRKQQLEQSEGLPITEGYLDDAINQAFEKIKGKPGNPEDLIEIAIAMLHRAIRCAKEQKSKDDLNDVIKKLVRIQENIF